MNPIYPKLKTLVVELLDKTGDLNNLKTALAQAPIDEIHDVFMVLGKAGEVFIHEMIKRTAAVLIPSTAFMQAFCNTELFLRAPEIWQGNLTAIAASLNIDPDAPGYTLFMVKLGDAANAVLDKQQGGNKPIKLVYHRVINQYNLMNP